MPWVPLFIKGHGEANAGSSTCLLTQRWLLLFFGLFPLGNFKCMTGTWGYRTLFVVQYAHLVTVGGNTSLYLFSWTTAAPVVLRSRRLF